MHKRTAHGDFDTAEDGENDFLSTVRIFTSDFCRTFWQSLQRIFSCVDAEVFQASPQGTEQNERDAEVTMETDDIISSHLQVLGTAVTMVTQDGTTIAVPAHQGRTGQQVTMVTDGKELQPVGIMGWTLLHGYQSSSHSPISVFVLQVAIVTSDDIMTEGSSSPYQQVALLATENGTQIAVQVSTKHLLLQFAFLYLTLNVRQWDRCLTALKLLLLLHMAVLASYRKVTDAYLKIHMKQHT